MQFLETQGATQDGFLFLKLARFDTFGDGNFFLAGQEGNAAHLVQVHLDRVTHAGFHARGH